MSVLNKIITKLNSLKQKRAFVREMNRLEDKVGAFCKNNSIPPLSENDYNVIKKFWEPYVHYEVKPYFYSILSRFDFDYPLYQAVNQAIMFNCIIRKLNPIEATQILSNKGMYSSIFQGFNRPVELLKCCSNNILNQNNDVVTIDKGISAILEYNKPFIIKPIVDSHGGFNVEIISNYTKKDLYDIINKYKNNFVIQALVEQSIQTKKLNPTSLNTFRVVTLMLNGKLSVLSCFVRCGGKGAIVDNACSGGMVIGINKDNGRLTRGTNFEKLEIHESPTGIKLSDYKIENFNRIIEFAEKLHTRIPLVALAGWDIALDENEQPVFIEVNLNKPSVWLMQVCNGPIFGERFEEVLEYCFKQN